MPEHTPQIQNRSETWSLADEGFEKVIKKDYYGNKYTAWVAKQKPNLEQLWDKFRSVVMDEERQHTEYKIIAADTDLHDETQQLDSEAWNEKVEQYFDNQLNEDI